MLHPVAALLQEHIGETQVNTAIPRTFRAIVLLMHRTRHPIGQAAAENKIQVDTELRQGRKMILEENVDIEHLIGRTTHELCVSQLVTLSIPH